MSFELFIAKRYALTKRSEQFITIISALSALGIMVGVAALICVLSVFNGFSKVVTDILVNFDPHIRITAKADSSVNQVRYLGNIDELVSKAKSFPSVKAAAAVVKEKAVIIHYTLPRVAIISGIDVRDVDRVSGLAKTVQAGTMQLDSQGIVLGQLLADNLAIATGDTVQVFSSVGMERILTEPVMPRSKYFIVRGIFAANNRDYDGNNAYVNIESARDLFEIPPNAATQVDIRLDDISQSQQTKQAMLHSFSSQPLTIETWYDLHKDLYNVMEIERWIAYVILIMIVAVASFSIFSALTLTVFEKRRDIGLLTALGAQPSQVRRIFLMQGLITGIAGVLIGCILGLVVVWAQQQFGFFRLDTSVYIIPALPVELHLLDFIAVGFGALVLVIVAAIFPARRAAETTPAESLRWE
ncbi:MAG TPA: ABC transporter permease [Candidatus Kapabacteria bacterium]|nr:ABC transporter permease [Candidatus Kapabacteria bacterium]